MVNPVLFGEHLAAMLKDEKTAFVKTDQPILDFTKVSDTFLTISGRKGTLKLPLNNQLHSFVGLLKEYVFCKDITVIAWDIKSLLSYLQFQEPLCSLDIYGDKIVDLKLIEAFQLIQKPAPDTWQEAMTRIKAYSGNNAAWKIHNAIHRPLATKVIPALETCGVVDTSSKIQKTLYPSYTIEGQIQGRLSCHLAFDRTINPHSLAEEQKAIIGPKFPFSLFVQLDFRAMEVAVLQWLSNDPLLGQIISDPDKDVYAEVFRIITDSQDVTEEDRSLAKKFFLPVFYGLQSYALSQSLGISQQMAQGIIDTIAEKFPVAWEWTESKHKEAEETKQVVDYFGRVRPLEESYRARHFSIAAPAAVICLEKLIRLYEALPVHSRILFSIHDGYVLATDRENLNKVVKRAKDALEATSPLYPGLKLRMKAEAGKKLTKLTKLF